LVAVGREGLSERLRPCRAIPGDSPMAIRVHTAAPGTIVIGMHPEFPEIVTMERG